LLVFLARLRVIWFAVKVENSSRSWLSAFYFFAIAHMCVCVRVNEQHEEQSDLAMSPVPQRNGSLLTRLPTYRWGLFQQ